MSVTAVAWVVGAIWLWLVVVRDFFWLCPVDDKVSAPPPDAWPPVTAIVPARNEADVIAETLTTLAAQDYPGTFEIIVVDDASSDETASIAREIGARSAHPLGVINAPPLAHGWTGKLWALNAGIGAAEDRGAPAYFWFTDADIAHTPDTLRQLVTRATSGNCVLVSRMALLRCQSLAERALIPAFVFFFQLLYPFRAVNLPKRSTAAAAGGCVLVAREALEAAGGIASVRNALIDDCALGAALKRQGPIWLGLSRDTRSIRPYPRFADVGAMIARSAYAQLGYQPLLLVGTLVGLGLTYFVAPALALFGSGMERALGVCAWGLMALLFQPMLRLYRRSPLWGLAMPLIALFYGGATAWSAYQHHRGRGGLWKGRIQAALE